MLRHERMTVRMELAAALHHSWGGGLVTHDGPRAQKTASAGLAEYFELSSDDGRPAGGERPAALLEPRPQERDRRHTGVGYEIAQNLEVPVPQMGEQLPAAQLPVVAEPVIDVPKILPQVIPLRRRRRRTQLAEQLVHVPTVVSYSSLQQLTAEQIVDIPVPGGGGGRGSLQGSRVRPRPNRAAYCGADSRAEDRFPRQNPAADVGQFPDIPARRGLSDFLPGQGSSASSSGLHDGADDGIQGFFRTFPRHKKKSKARQESECGAAPGGQLQSGSQGARQVELVDSFGCSRPRPSYKPPEVQIRCWEWVMVLSGERPYFWNRRTGETCLEMEEGCLASWLLRPDGFYVMVRDGTVHESIDDM